MTSEKLLFQLSKLSAGDGHSYSAPTFNIFHTTSSNKTVFSFTSTGSVYGVAMTVRYTLRSTIAKSCVCELFLERGGEGCVPVQVLVQVIVLSL